MLARSHRLPLNLVPNSNALPTEEREREIERERETETETETDRQTDRQTYRQRQGNRVSPTTYPLASRSAFA